MAAPAAATNLLLVAADLAMLLILLLSSATPIGAASPHVGGVMRLLAVPFGGYRAGMVSPRTHADSILVQCSVAGY